jgi:chemotaxis protein MotB
MRAGLASAEAERDRVKGLYDGLAGAGASAQGRATELGKALDPKTGFRPRLGAGRSPQPADQRLRRQLAALEEALDASEKRDKESQTKIADLGQRLNVALAQRVQELSRYRSEFFGACAPSSAIAPMSALSATASCSSLKCSSIPDSAAAAGRPRRTRQARQRSDRSRQADPRGNRLGAARRRPYRRSADQQPAVQVELGTVIGTRDFGGAVSRIARRAGTASGRGRVCGIPAADPEKSEEAYKRNRRIELKLTER